ncbi:MAG: 30S ribosomal protein S5 [Dehalococcoidia bacterium]
MTNNFDRNQQQIEGEDAPFVERVVRISRVAKVVKGGRHLSFNAVVVVGDGEGHVGIGMGKADAVPDAVRKGAANARKNIVQITLKGSTIPHEVLTKYGGALVMMKPASPGTGVIAGGAVRAVVELAGVRDILTKARRSTNPVNVVKATFEGLKSLRDPQEEIRRREALVGSMAERARNQAERRAARQARQAAAQAQASQTQATDPTE